MQLWPAGAMAWRLAGLIVAAPLIRHVGAVVYTDEPEVDMAGFLRSLDICLLEPGAPGSPVNVSLPWFGTLQITRFCCSGTEVANLSAAFATSGGGASWQGGADVFFALGELTTHCTGNWTMSNGKKGGVAFDVSKDNKTAAPLQLNLSMDGKKIVTTEGEYPFPLNVPGKAECTDDPLITGIQFTGADATVLNALGYIVLTGAFQEWLVKPMIKDFCETSAPSFINKALAQLRDQAAPLLREVAEDLSAPVAPAGSGPRVDLRHGAVGWVSGLLQQGFATGQVTELLDRISQDTGFRSEIHELPGTGVQLANMAMEHPADMTLNVFLQGAGVAGLRTLSVAGAEAVGPEMVAVSMRQAALNLSAEIGLKAATGAAGAGDRPARQLLAGGGGRLSAAAAAERLMEELLDRFQLHLALENLTAGARVGLLLDEDRVRELTRGQSWYDTTCMRGMVQNVSVTGVDVLVTVPRFVWSSVGRSSGALEVDIDAAINSLLGYLNVPQMRPTVSRLVQSVAAGKVRDAANVQLQGVLANVTDSECTPKNGFQQMPLFYVLAFAAGIAVLAAGAFWRWSKVFERLREGARPLRAKSEGLAVALLALASFCLQQCGLLALPLRAALRFRSGDQRNDIFANVFVLELADPIGRIDGFLLVAVASVVLGAARALLAALAGLDPKASRWALRLAAFGGCGYSLTAILASTQVVAFHISILTFGDSSMELGCFLGVCVYLQLLGLYLCDVATLVVLKRCGADRPLGEEKPATTSGEGNTAGHPLAPEAVGALAASAAPPRGAMAVGLAGVLAMSLVVPWITLWSQEWGGVVGRVATYQAQDLQRYVSLADVIASEGFLLNTGPLELGARVMQLFVLLHVLAAPVVHAVLAVAVGMRLRGCARPLASATCTSGRGSLEASSGEPPKLPSRHLVRGLELARMWSGADVFAVAVAVSVTELGAELAMMRQQMCSTVDPMLPDTVGCFELDGRVRPGLAVLLAWGLASRLLAELCAHRPLRRLRLRASAVAADCEAELGTASAAEGGLHRRGPEPSVPLGE